MSYYNPKYEQNINEYLDGKFDDGYFLRSMGSKVYIEYLLNRYLIKNPHRKTEIINILDNLDEIDYSNLTHEHLKIIMEKSIKENKSNYAKILYNFLFLDESSIECLIEKHNITKDKFDALLNKFIKYYPKQDEEIKYLNDTYNKYLKNKEEHFSSITIEEYFKSNKGFNEQELRLIDIYNSGYSIEEYCSNVGMLYKVAKFALEKCKKGSDKKIKQVALEVENRDNSNFLNSLKDLCYYISTHKEFDVLDYFDNTKLSLNDFRDIVNPFISRQILVKVLKQLGKLKYLNNNISVQFELDSTTVIGGRTITKEE